MSLYMWSTGPYTTRTRWVPTQIPVLDCRGQLGGIADQIKIAQGYVVPVSFIKFLVFLTIVEVYGVNNTGHGVESCKERKT